jgi:hypothetical protein
MTKFIQIIKFIKKYRALGLAHFSVCTNSDTFVLTADYNGKKEQLRLKYK